MGCGALNPRFAFENSSDQLGFADLDPVAVLQLNRLINLITVDTRAVCAATVLNGKSVVVDPDFAVQTADSNVIEKPDVAVNRTTDFERSTLWDGNRTWPAQDFRVHFSESIVGKGTLTIRQRSVGIASVGLGRRASILLGNDAGSTAVNRPSFRIHQM